MCPQYQHYLIILTQKPIWEKQSPRSKKLEKEKRTFGGKTEMGYVCNLITRQIWEEPQRSQAMAGDRSKALAAQGVCFVQGKEGQGWGWSSTCPREMCDLGLSWRLPALPPEPRQKLQGLLSVFLALFLRYHVPAADFLLLLAPCTGGAMLTLVTWICSSSMPGKGKASSPQHHSSNPACSSPWPHSNKSDYFWQCMK